MKVTIGGDRLGSGNKNKTALKNYERSTFNLTQKFTSSMQVGTLYPFLVVPAMRGDKFEIDLEADGRTIPTKGPLFGSFKMQVDVFECPVRLYQAILHNNPLKIGLNMGQVKFPMLNILDTNGNAFSNNCLLKYLGVSGLGHRTNVHGQGTTVNRFINAIPALSYYEIFKTYYSNKQEELAYTIGTEIVSGDLTGLSYTANNTPIIYGEMNQLPLGFVPFVLKIDTNGEPNGWQKQLCVIWYDENEVEIGKLTFDNSPLIKAGFVEKRSEYEYFIKSIPYHSETFGATAKSWEINCIEDDAYYSPERGLEAFPLANIDEMRLKILSYNNLGLAFKIENTEDDEIGVWDKGSGVAGYQGLPYTKLVDVIEQGDNAEKTLNVNPLNGLVVKTYQSDIFNNWINTDWIDGENGIAAITAISTASGSIKVDTINLSEKLYNMLNRIAVSDGSYEGWQDAVYTDTPKRHIESPIYLGGMSSEIMFEEIVQTTPTDESPLGNLGGKGKLFKRKGGHVVVKCSEACFIIGIVSLTPRVNYCQGNEFYMTDLKSMDDFHKPALDGIGFQNLIAERMAWWDTGVEPGYPVTRHTIGKVPAWMEYMTAIDKCYGDFAETEGRGFMTLLRDYSRTNNNQIKDATTYIDPRKYNYAFAVTDIDAQNFWVQIKSNIIARRLMSAKQIPNI